MTGLFTSYCLTNNIYESLTAERLKNINSTALLWGSIGGGFLTDVMSAAANKKDYDIYIEKNSNKLLKYLLKNKDTIAKNEQEKEALTSYIVGVSIFCGIIKIIEPLVQYNIKIIDSNDTDEYTRNRIWSNMDIIVLRYNTGKIPSEIKLRDIFVTNNVLENLIIKIYRGFLSEFNLSDNDIILKLNSFSKLLNKLDDKSSLKKLFFQKIEKYSGKKSLVNSMLYSMTEDSEFDYSNSQKEEWELDGSKSTDDLFELYDKVKDMAHEAGYRILQI